MRFMSAMAAPPRKVALNVESAARQAVIFRLARALVRLARDRLNAKKISAARHAVIVRLARALVRGLNGR